MGRFRNLFQNVRYPIIQAPMAGGSTTSMAVASCNSGCIGSLGVGTQSPDRISMRISEIKEGLNDPNALFNMNVFCINYELKDPTSEPLATNITLTQQFLQQYINDNNLNEQYPDLAPGTVGEAPYIEDVDAQIDAIIAGGAPIISSTFGTFSEEQVTKIKNAGLMIMGTATNADEAEHLSGLDVDGIVLQGSYAGGHRAGWTTGLDGYFYDLVPLIESVVQRLGSNNEIPLIACGGIMTSSDINSLLCNTGADACQLGTVFLNTAEADYLSQNWKDAMRNPELNGFENIQVTENFTGKWEMPIINNLYKALEAFRLSMLQTNPDYKIPDWPFMDAISAPFHITGDTNLMSMYCGRNTSEVTQYEANISVSDLVTQLVSELDDNTKSGKGKRGRGRDRRDN